MKGDPLPSPPPAMKPPAAAPHEAAEPPGARPGPAGGFTTLDGQRYYRLAYVHRMPPFLMSVPSDTDLWMFITSDGGLTAGRVDPDGSLFPYETADKLHDGHLHTGPVTLVHALRAGAAPVLWQPFADRALLDGRVERNLYKNVIGNRIVFEEIHHDLGLAFRYRWVACDAFGWVRTATLSNPGGDAVKVSVLDGLRNVLPCGAPLALYQQSSSLVDAYKRTDLDPEARLAIFSLTARITDRAEPAESLRANTVWLAGLAGAEIHLGAEAVAAFRRGEVVPTARVRTGRRGSFLAVASLELEPGGSAKWHVAADAGRSHAQIAALRARMLEGGTTDVAIERALDGADQHLLRIVGGADGIQLTGRVEASAHHFANTLYNGMRGGVFASGYDVPVADLTDFIRTRNRPVAARHEAWLRTLPSSVTAMDLAGAARRTGDADLERLCLEYLPIWFGRRHGDPSRPWNRFSIRVRNPDGARALRYEGNWRDIFQNWEALGVGFPRFLPGFIARFVNASTVDGFNPYRITRDGVDWEVVDPDDPWSYIGYWGDHQIVYLLKFLEALQRSAPGALRELLGREVFCYADVPYRLRPYAEIVRDPRHTIVYDAARAERVETRVRALGTDGRLIAGPDGAVLRVNLLEKLLVPALSKLSNLIPGGGIWMNTQRPEWNDANNALVGNGVSMVTLCYLRRYLRFLEELLEGAAVGSLPVSVEVGAWLRDVHAILEKGRPLPGRPCVDDRARRRVMDALGAAFGAYRERVYATGPSRKEPLLVAEVVALCRCALGHLDHAIRANRREDGLYHAYNLLRLSDDDRAAGLRRLDEMLEGQVAALSSGLVDAREAADLVARLFESRLYTAGRRSFLLYPERVLPAFMERNVVPEAKARAVPLLEALLGRGNHAILERDAGGVLRFNADFSNAAAVGSALDRLERDPAWAEAVARDRRAVLDVFESVFDHHAFTGRSGTMYGYEGLGCIYWHMVAKLLLAVQEVAARAERDGAPEAVRRSLAGGYERIRAGLGFEKTAVEYGAFPTDPYSHTPAHAGAQQPGMTGQVKEEILTRFGELGVAVEEGVVRFRPFLLGRAEFLDEPGTYRFHDPAGGPRALEVPAGSLAFSFCQVPVVYTPGPDPWIRVTLSDGRRDERAGDRLDADLSRALLDRRGGIERIEVVVADSALRP